MSIDTIMFFAAGLGSRMRHLTDNRPKCLINVLEIPILHRALDFCNQYTFKKIIINTHYLSNKVEESIQEYIKLNPNCPPIHIIYEEELYETGGAIKNAKDIIGQNPIFTMNTDIIIQNASLNIFDELSKHWAQDKMELLMLMQPLKKAVGYVGKGDFNLADDGKLLRPDIDDHYDYIYSGLQIIDPTRIYNNPLKIFSLKEYYLNSDRVYGLQIKGTKWFHVSSPEDLIDVEMALLNE